MRLTVYLILTFLLIIGCRIKNSSDYQQPTELINSEKIDEGFMFKTVILNERRMGVNPTLIKVNAPFSNRKLFVGVNISVRATDDMSLISIQNYEKVILFDFINERVSHTDKKRFLSEIKRLYPNTTSDVYLTGTFVKLDFEGNNSQNIEFEKMNDIFQEGLGDMSDGYFPTSFFSVSENAKELFINEDLEELINEFKDEIIYASSDGIKIEELSVY